MSLRHVLLPWIVSAAYFSVFFALLSPLSLLIGKVIAQLFTGESLSWLEFDTVVHMAKWGAAIGFIVGTGIWVDDVIEHKKT
jgi:hypothetical protein